MGEKAVEVQSSQALQGIFPCQAIELSAVGFCAFDELDFDSQLITVSYET